MTISTIKSEDGKALTIKIQGRFDFGEHQAFRDAYERISRRPAEYVIDLNETTYLDSSALGMLLLLRDHAGGDEADIKIVNCKPDVKKILLISNFEQLFAIQ
ncbi:STAS domain-containing protein [Spartinivicinus poritis]|uniref:STAS domain-containing protein n=1 Tax=Spartinivicinus poritis TaxID=2994640 RepID=A0ABT5U7S0_9GAMM|nr:STAS domain-containing protein [Spartinivicinus sp. A2-2]MDE1461458.1 STAS domain-containing protein [Spartinivicinus sp. A2-2]